MWPSWYGDGVPVGEGGVGLILLPPLSSSIFPRRSYHRVNIRPAGERTCTRDRARAPVSLCTVYSVSCTCVYACNSRVCPTCLRVYLCDVVGYRWCTRSGARRRRINGARDLAQRLPLCRFCIIGRGLRSLPGANYRRTGDFGLALLKRYFQIIGNTLYTFLFHMIFTLTFHVYFICILRFIFFILCTFCGIEFALESFPQMHKNPRFNP